MTAKRTRPQRQAPARASSAASARPAPSARSATAATAWTDGRWALAFGALAALLRILFVLSGTDRTWPFTVYYEGDSETFFRFARALLAGELYDGGIPFHPPGFAFFLSGLHALVGAGAANAEVPHLAIKVILAIVVGGGSVALLYLATSAIFDRATAIVAALLVSFHFGLYVISAAPVGDGLFQLLLLAAIALFVRHLDFGRRASLAGAAMLGLLGGAMALTRAEGLLYALVFAGWMTIAQWRTRPAGAARLQFLHATLVTMLVACVVVMPWTIRNALRLGEANRRLAGGISEPLPRFVPVTLYGPLNLALANHDGADGAFSRAILPDRDGSGQLRLNDPDQLRFMLHGDRIAGEWIAAHPGDFARLVMKKWALYFGSLRLGWTQWDLPGGLTGLRRPVDIFVPQRPWALVFWLPALLGGAWFAGRGGARERQWLGLTLLLTGAALGVVAFFFGYARLGLLLVPLWATLGAVAVVRAARGLAGKLPARRMAALRGRSGRIAAGALVVLLLGIEVAGAIRGHRLEATGSTLTSTNRLNRDQPVSFRPLP